jgi:hypothetical protein
MVFKTQAQKQEEKYQAELAAQAAAAAEAQAAQQATVLETALTEPTSMGTEFDPGGTYYNPATGVTTILSAQESLIQQADPQAYHQQQIAATKAAQIAEENQKRIDANRARELRLEQKEQQYEADLAQYAQDVEAYKEQQRQIQTGEIVMRDFKVDTGLQEFGDIERTDRGLLLSQPDPLPEAGIPAVRDRFTYKYLEEPELEEYEGKVPEKKRRSFEEEHAARLRAMYEAPPQYYQFDDERTELYPLFTPTPKSKQLAAEFGDPTLIQRDLRGRTKFPYSGPISEFEGSIESSLMPKQFIETRSALIDEIILLDELTGEYDPGIKRWDYEGVGGRVKQTVSTPWGDWEKEYFTQEGAVGPRVQALYEQAGIAFPVHETELTWMGKDQYEPYTSYDPGFIYGSGGQAGIMRDTIDWDILEFAEQAAMLSREEYQRQRGGYFPNIRLLDKSLTPQEKRHRQRDTFKVRGYDIDRDLFNTEADVLTGAIEADEISEFEFDNLDYRVARDDYRGVFTDMGIASGDTRAKAILRGRGSAPDYLTQFDDIDTEFGHWVNKFDRGKVDPRFKKAFNELKREKNLGRFQGSTAETIWNILPNAAYATFMLPTISHTQLKKAIQDFHPIQEGLERWEDDPYGFGGDIIGSLIGFTGGVAALSKIPGIAGQASSRGAVWLVQADEEILTMLGTKAFPEFTKKIGGTFDWEEALFKSLKKQIDKGEAWRRGKTYKEYIKERKVDLLKKHEAKSKQKILDLEIKMTKKGWMKDAESIFLKKHEIIVGKELDREIKKKKLIEDYRKGTSLQADLETIKRLKKQTGRKELSKSELENVEVLELSRRLDLEAIESFRGEMEGYELPLELELIETELEGPSPRIEFEFEQEQEVDTELEAEMELEMEMEMEMEVEMEMEMEMEAEAEMEAEMELEAELEAEIEAELEMELELEIELDKKKSKTQEDDFFGRMFGGVGTFERYAPVKTKLDPDIEEMLKGL